MSATMRFGHRLSRSALALADRAATSPPARWTWSRLAEDGFSPGLPEIRPSDPDTVHDMMSGRYLLGGHFVETRGASPFNVTVENAAWVAELHGFAWLRHFREVRDGASRRFARVLVLDWIGRHGGFTRRLWTGALTGQRVLNWLRALDIVLEGAGPEETRRITRALGMQVQSLRARAGIMPDPLDRAYARMALVAAALSAEADVAPPLKDLNDLLDDQTYDDGLSLTRSPRVQLRLLVELTSLRQALDAGEGQGGEARLDFLAILTRMHEALARLTLGQGEPGYFNGTGQLPHDTLIAVEAQSSRLGSRVSGVEARAPTGRVGGFAVARLGEGVLVADGGERAPAGFDAEQHLGALSFEFTHRGQVIVGNCGPAPSALVTEQALFAATVAHSAPSIEGIDNPGSSDPAEIAFGAEPGEASVMLASEGYRKAFGARLERRLTLIGDGATLVGQDRVALVRAVSGRDAATPSHLLVRFHLAPGTEVGGVEEGLVRLALADGRRYAFLFEGARVTEDESVRHSMALGLYRTRQLVLEAPLVDGAEIAWVFAPQSD